MPTPTNYLNAFRGPDLAAIDNARYSNALAKNQVARIPQMNRAQDLDIQAAEQAVNAQQMETAAKVFGRSLASIASSPRPDIAYPQFLGSPEFKSLSAVLRIPEGAYSYDPRVDTPESIRTNAAKGARHYGFEMAQSEPEKLPTGMRMGTGGPEWVPGYLEGQERLRSAGASRINVGVQDAQRDNELERATTGVQDIDRILGMMDNGGKLPDVGVGAWLKNVPGTDALNIDKLLVGIKGGIAVDQLQAMRAASPTGGALGNVTERELSMLESLRGSLDQSQSAEQFRDNLNRYRNALLDVIHGPGAGPPRRQLGFQQPAQSGGPARIQGDAEYDALPSGTLFVGPDGITRRKP